MMWNKYTHEGTPDSSIEMFKRVVEAELTQLSSTSLIPAECFELYAGYDVKAHNYILDVVFRVLQADPIVVDGNKHYNVIPASQNEAKLYVWGAQKRWETFCSWDESDWLSAVPHSALHAVLTDEQATKLAHEILFFRTDRVRIPYRKVDYLKHWLVKTFPLMTAPLWQPHYHWYTTLRGY